MIKLIEMHYQGNFRIAMTFSDGAEGVFDGNEFLKREGPLLDRLRTESFFQKAFIDAGALCWPNGLELSPTKLHHACTAVDHA